MSLIIFQNIFFVNESKRLRCITYTLCYVQCFSRFSDIDIPFSVKINSVKEDAFKAEMMSLKR